MASKKIEMYAEKQHELEELRENLKTGMGFRWNEVEFKDEILQEFGEARSLLLIFERYYVRNGSYASLVILLSEFEGRQKASVIATGGKETLFSWGAEGDFAKLGEDALRGLGFSVKTE